MNSTLSPIGDTIICAFINSIHSGCLASSPTDSLNMILNCCSIFFAFTYSPNTPNLSSLIDAVRSSHATLCSFIALASNHLASFSCLFFFSNYLFVVIISLTIGLNTTPSPPCFSFPFSPTFPAASFLIRVVLGVGL